jgi:tetratricopeptide (TPR) repeat protein
MVEEALVLSQTLGDRHREMQSLLAMANQRLWINDPSGWGLAEQALALARELGDRRFEVGILTRMGRVYEWSDQPERGAAFLEAALPISQDLGDRMAELDLLYLIGLKYERAGDYCRLLKQFHEKRLRISREIHHRPAEALALMQCGQIRGLYLGDLEGGLKLLRESLGISEGTPTELYVWLRIAQIHVAGQRWEEALEALEHARRIARVQAIPEMGQAGLCLVSAIFHNGMAVHSSDGVLGHLEKALALAAEAYKLVVETPLTQQYELAAACEASTAHLALGHQARDEATRDALAAYALESSEAALAVYEQFGFVQVVECLSEEVLLRHSLALAANGREEESTAFLTRAYVEMMRKWALVPEGSSFRETWFEGIGLHRTIRSLVEQSTGERLNA